MNRSERLAVLIDAENISHAQADRIFELVAALGTPTVRRIYGDFEGSAKSWTGAAARHALEPQHCFSPAKGKNGADIRLTVDAMDLLHDSTVQGFCIVSSDGDFAALVRRIRREGHQAVGIGRSVTTAGYRDACTKFLVLDQPAPTAASSSAPALKPHPALPAIHRALGRCAPGPDGWYHLGTFGSAAKLEGLTPKEYGASRFKELLTVTGHFTFKEPQHFRKAPLLRAVAGGQ